MICDTCAGILQRREGLVHSDVDSLLFVHHRKASSLRTSALQGCHICQPFWSQLSQVERDALLDFKPPEEEVINNEDPEGWTAKAHQMKRHITFCMLKEGELLEMQGSYIFAVHLNGGIDLSHISKKNTYALDCMSCNHQLVCVILVSSPVLLGVGWIV
jgi:hypothetical protein